MSVLGDNMVNINSILEMIHAVADQTNLLALNASIEAARAGEHGRGFAVVANEVRTLAERSRKSTEEIQSFFDQLQGSSGHVAKLMQECLEHADSSMAQADRSGESLDKITEVAKLIVEHNTAIATAMEENARGTEEINRAVVNINTGSQNTAQTALASEQRSTELAHLSDRLESLVNQFKI
jgi:methyl-accepting chemotaxis protein